MARIRHTVVFRLKHPTGSPEEISFKAAAMELAGITGVEKFEYLKQVSTSNAFEFGISMEFADQATYDAYSSHADHEAFVENYWMKNVEDFIEIDYLIPS